MLCYQSDSTSENVILTLMYRHRSPFESVAPEGQNKTQSEQHASRVFRRLISLREHRRERRGKSIERFQTPKLTGLFLIIQVSEIAYNKYPGPVNCHITCTVDKPNLWSQIQNHQLKGRGLEINKAAEDRHVRDDDELDGCPSDSSSSSAPTPKRMQTVRALI